MESLVTKWSDLSTELHPFIEYFRKRKAPEIKQSMLIERRIACHLRLDPYTQNANECMNHVIKQGMEKKLGLKDFIDHAKKIVDRQENDLGLATIGRMSGLRLGPLYLHLFLDEGYFGKLSAEKRNQQLNKIHVTGLIPKQPSLSMIE